MKKLLLLILVTFSMCFGLSGVALAAVTPGEGTTSTSPRDSAKAEVCEGIQGEVGGTCGTGALSVQKVMTAVLQVISFIAGIAAVVMVIVAGLKYITSSGEASSISSAKSTLIYAVIGLVVVAVAQFIVHYVLSRVD